VIGQEKAAVFDHSQTIMFMWTYYKYCYMTAICAIYVLQITTCCSILSLSQTL